MRILKILFLALFFIAHSCGAKKSDVLEYFSYETECEHNELNGLYSVRAWGKGKNSQDALEQAKINALNDLLFKGIRRGKSDCKINPLVVEANAREKYDKYFNDFFSKKHLYSKYISKKDGSSKRKFTSVNEVVYEISFQIEPDKLKKRLIKDEIINQ